MTKPILVSCDSACDISPELRDQYGIQITPMYIHEGEKTFRDGVDITPEDIYRTYDETGLLPQTSAVSPDGPPASRVMGPDCVRRLCMSKSEERTSPNCSI